MAGEERLTPEPIEDNNASSIAEQGIIFESFEQYANNLTERFPPEEFPEDYAKLFIKVSKRLPPEWRRTLASSLETKWRPAQPEEVIEALKTIIDVRVKNGRRVSGPKPVQYERIRNLYTGHESEAFSIGSIAEALAGEDTPYSRNLAWSAINKLNGALEEYGFPPRIQSSQFEGETYYRFMTETPEE